VGWNWQSFCFCAGSHSVPRALEGGFLPIF
jgi:hypothetical protein